MTSSSTIVFFFELLSRLTKVNDLLGQTNSFGSFFLATNFLSSWSKSTSSSLLSKFYKTYSSSLSSSIY